jgi:CheY-like chemotaxis protein
MTHELRTPLHAVIGAAHLLIRNNPREDQHEELQILRFSAENLLSLINNILDFQKIENGKVALETIPFNLKNLVDEIVAALNIRAKEKGIELRCHLDERLPEHLLGDPLRLSQIINNLTGNAMKFTEQGYVAVDVLMKERVGEDILADFFIRDTGIGMSRETLDTVFEIFVQGSSETTRKYGGTGLGLVITKKLLELYGSEIRVESEPGKGSCFSFSIRFREAAGEEHKAPVSHKHYEFSRFNGQRILLVEDNLVNKVIAGKFLKDWDLSFDHAINGQVALTMAKEHYYDLILMDIQMPEMDGYQASSAIRALGSTYHASVPIIALTAAIRSDVSAMIFRSGMNDYISKPFNPVDLHQKLSNYLSIG